MTEEKEKKKKSIFLKIIKKIKISHILMLSMLLAVNSYAWFIYVNTVQNKIDVHVRSWKIDFNDGDSDVVNYVDVVVNDVYPGMQTFEKTIEAKNYGEMEANVKYKILSAKIMGDEYLSVEGRENAGESPVATDLTSEELEQKLSNDYPFKILFTLSSSVMSAGSGTATYNIKVKWDYESGNDEADTYWGNKAYDFIKANPDTPCIEMKIKIYISQATS